VRPRVAGSERRSVGSTLAVADEHHLAIGGLPLSEDRLSLREAARRMIASRDALRGAGGRSGAREMGVPPGSLACTVADIRVGTALVLAFGHRTLLGQATKCPPCRVRSAGRAAWRGSVHCGLGGMVLVSNLLGVHLRAHLCPRVPAVLPGLKLPE
jgi:hypothetical protein